MSITVQAPPSKDALEKINRLLDSAEMLIEYVGDDADTVTINLAEERVAADEDRMFDLKESLRGDIKEEGVEKRLRQKLSRIEDRQARAHFNIERLKNADVREEEDLNSVVETLKRDVRKLRVYLSYRPLRSWEERGTFV